MKATPSRQKYFVIASLLYVALGCGILIRALLANAMPVVLLGAIFIALGLVRLRDFRRWRNSGT